MENKDQRYFLDDSNMIYIKPGPNVAPFPVATVSDTEIEVTVARALKAFSAELQRKSKGRQTQVKYAREGMAELVEVLEGGKGSGYFAPGHRGRPDEVGGSLPLVVDPSAGSFLVGYALEDAKLPETHTDSLQGVGWQESDYVRTQIKGDGIVEAYGTYTPATSTIRLAMNAPRGGNISVFGGAVILHEIGHHVHTRKLTDAAAVEWERYSHNGFSARVSAYARTNRGEHFAEAYREYTRGGDHRAKLKVLEPGAYKFMQRVYQNNSKYVLPIGILAPLSGWEKRYAD